MPTKKIYTGQADILPILLLLASFILLNVYLSQRGMFFVITPLENFYQVLDLYWLKTDLLRSIVYLHSQPPLFNLVIGIILIRAGVYATQVFNIVYQVLAFGIILLLYCNQRVLRVNPWLALSICLFWMSYPAFIYFQNFLFYPIPVQFLLLLAALFLSLSFAATKKYLHAFFLVLFFLSTLRSTYNVLYIGGVLALILLLNKTSRKIILLASIPAGILLLTLIIKNLVLFDQISPSSWLGMNLANTTIKSLGKPEKESLIASGNLSPIVQSDPFSDISSFPRDIWQAAAQRCTGPDALCQARKSNGEPNLNFIGYIPVSNEFLKADLYFIQHYPFRFIRQITEGWRFYTSPSHLTHYVNQKAFRSIKPWASFTDRYLCGGITDVYEAKPCYPIQFIYTSVIVLSAGVLGIRILKQMSTPVETNTILFILFTLIYTALVGSILDLGENNRFRLETDPLFVLLCCYLIAVGIRSIAQLRDKSPTTP